MILIIFVASLTIVTRYVFTKSCISGKASLTQVSVLMKLAAKERLDKASGGKQLDETIDSQMELLQNELGMTTVKQLANNQTTDAQITQLLLQEFEPFHLAHLLFHLETDVMLLI